MNEQALEIFKSRWPETPLYGELVHYKFPKTFGSTAGPFGGIGGAMMTTFSIDAFEYPDGQGKAVLFCGGRFWKTTEKFWFAGCDF